MNGKLLNINKLYMTEFSRVQVLVTATEQPLYLSVFLPPSFSGSYLILTRDTSFFLERVYVHVISLSHPSAFFFPFSLCLLLSTLSYLLLKHKLKHIKNFKNTFQILYQVSAGISSTYFVAVFHNPTDTRGTPKEAHTTLPPEVQSDQRTTERQSILPGLPTK